MAIVVVCCSSSISAASLPRREGRFWFRRASCRAFEAQRIPVSLALFPPLLVDTQSFGELVFQNDDPARGV